MTKLFRHILTLLVLLMLLPSCGGRKDKVIPRSKLAEIYAEMMLVDQWMIANPTFRQQADTSLVYEPILNEYGYTSADYRKSVDVYMNDPERFARILRTTAQVLDRKLLALQAQRTEEQRLEALRQLKESMKIEVAIDMGEFFPYLDDQPYVQYYDSLAIDLDTLAIYRFRNIDRGDTIYRDLRMVILDSLAVKDSLAVNDTLAIKDTLAVKDTLALGDKPALSSPRELKK